jgi:hypothetical protein
MLLPSAMTRIILASTLVSGLMLPTRVQGQDPGACPQGKIRWIEIENGPILDPSSIENRRFSWAWRWVDRLHLRTRESFLRKDLLFSEGECFDPLLLEDSEQLLRRYPFIASASIRGRRQEDGDWFVKVDTRDEWSTRFNLSVSLDGRLLFQGLSLAEINLLGRGITGSLFYSRVDQSRDRGAFLAFPRVLGSRLNGSIAGARTRTGHLYSLQSSYPFPGESGRNAGLVLLAGRDDYRSYGTGSREGISHVLLPVQDRQAELTLAHRWGEIGDLLELGFTLAHRDTRVSPLQEDARVAENDRFGQLTPVSDSLFSIVAPEAHRTRSTVAGFLLGHRAVHLRPRRGLELIQGTMDVATGVEISTYLAAGIHGEGSHVSGVGDLLLGGRIYTGAMGEDGVVNFRASLEGRRARHPDSGGDRWRDVRIASEALGYWAPAGSRGHLFGRLLLWGAWDVDQPYQSTLGGSSGLRGYFEEELPVGGGITASLEVRLDLPTLVPADVGLTAFVDGGRGWAEGVPFGKDTGWLGSVGGGVRFAFPSGSRSMLRLEGAWPMEPSTKVSDLLVRAYFADLQGLLGLRGNGRGARSRFHGFFNRLRGP